MRSTDGLLVRVLVSAALITSLLLAYPRAEDAALSPALASLVEMERAFARSAAQIGIRDSFLAYFADDAIALVPEAKPAKDRLRARPVRPFSELELTWEPRAGDVAAAGDLGWLTGPSTFIDHTASTPEPHYGNYLSVWRKGPAGEWRVFIDIGCDVPKAAPFPPGFVPLALPARWTGGEPHAAAVTSLRAADAALNAAVVRDGLAKGYALVLAEQARLHRQQIMPLAGRAAVVSYLEQQQAVPVSASSTAADAAASGDLGYSYGMYEARKTPAEHGAYVRVWARDASGRWWIVADVTQPAP